MPSLSITNDSLNLTFVPGLSRYPTQTTPLHVRFTLTPSLLSWPYHNVRVNVAALDFLPPDDVPWVKAKLPSMIYNVVKVHCPHAGLYSPDSETVLFDPLGWTTDFSGGDGLVVLAGSLYLVPTSIDLYSSWCEEEPLRD